MTKEQEMDLLSPFADLIVLIDVLGSGKRMLTAAGEPTQHLA